MATRGISAFPDPVLRKRTEPVQEITPDVLSLIEDMIETMYGSAGVGLAAPQVGVSLRVAVVDTSLGTDPDALLVLINPEMLSREGSQVCQEGCLSAPGVAEDLERAEQVRVRYLDREGKPRELEAEGLLARAIQHELDHLDGHMYWDRLSKVKRDQLKQRYRKQREEAG
jgi:peptide deformylase